MRPLTVGAMAGALLLGCGLGSRVASILPTTLPAQRPDDFQIAISTSGGMYPSWSTLNCGPSACVHTDDNQGVHTVRRGSVTPEDLDSLYADVREHRFDRIQMETHGVIYDSGGTTIVVTAGGKTWSFGASATESVAEVSEADFRAVHDATSGLVARLPMTEVPTP